MLKRLARLISIFKRRKVSDPDLLGEYRHEWADGYGMNWYGMDPEMIKRHNEQRYGE